MGNKEKNASCGFRTSIGGQALIEGILMRGPSKQAIAIRKPDGGICIKVDELHMVKEKHPILGWPFIRGVVNFLDSMIKGVQALTYSAEFLPEEEQEEPSRLDKWVEEKFGSEAAEKFIIGVAVAMGICLSVGLFILLPTIIAGLFTGVVESYFVRNLLEGLIRIIIFLGYLYLCTRLKDIKRLFAYHGAEHKTIFCYEHMKELTVDNVRPESRFHPRCGTSFLFVVVIISILVFAVVRWSNVWVRMLLRLVLLPVVVGISYEINRWIGRHDNTFTAILAWPGKQLQHLTTNEPDDSMIECAIAALKEVIPEEKGADTW